MVRILVVDHPIVRTGLVDLFAEEPGFEVVGEAATIAAARAAVAAVPPDVAVVDLALGTDSGLDLAAYLARSHPRVRILVISGHDERLYAERALRAGAFGSVMKDRPPDELVAAVRRVAAGRASVSADTADRILAALGMSRRGAADDRPPIERLSDREHHVLTLLGRGLATREIAGRLAVSVKTVESHLAHLKEKLGARNGRELIRLAVTWTESLPSAPTPTRRVPAADRQSPLRPGHALHR